MHIKQPPSRLKTSASENNVAINNYCSDSNGTNYTSIYILQSTSMENLRSEPTLTIQVNQSDDNNNNTGNIKQISSSSGVNIVSCFRPATDNSSVNSVNCVSVHKDGNLEKSDKSDSNENIVSEKSPQKAQATASEDLNEIAVDQVFINDNSTNSKNDNNLDKTDKDELLVNSESAKTRNIPESQTSREQRRRERRERRHARNRAQHVHIPVHQSLLNQRPPANRHGQLRQNYEILPDLSQTTNMPPPYTTLPLHSPLHSSAIGPNIPNLPSIIAPGPGEDCRFAFPIPVIRR